MSIEILEVESETPRFERVMDLANGVLNQGRQLVVGIPEVLESHILGAFQGARCVGFVRYLVQVIGAEEGRPAVTHDGVTLTEGYFEAFGVDPEFRRLGIGTALQGQAIEHCRSLGCHQMRSRSPVTSAENYALKIDSGYVLQPSEQNDSYYFLLRL
jgi:GNAT superfamily N-acetyltransferase